MDWQFIYNSETGKIVRDKLNNMFEYLFDFETKYRSGASGSILMKQSSADHDVEWTNVSFSATGDIPYETHEIFVPADSTSADPTEYVFELQNTIVDYTHVFVETENWLFKPTEFSYTVGDNTITIDLTQIYYTFDPTDKITVYYSYGVRAIAPPPAVIVDISITSLTYTVNSSNDIIINCTITNNGTNTESLVLQQQLQTWSTQEQIAFLVAGGGGTHSFTKTYPNVDPGTYNYYITGYLTDSLTNIVVSALPAPSYTYSNFNVIENGDVYTCTVDVKNVGSANGTTSVYFQLDSDSKVQVGANAINIGQTITFTTSYTVTALGSHTIKAFENNQTTQVDSTYNFTIVLSGPSSILFTNAQYAYYISGVPYRFKNVSVGQNDALLIRSEYMPQISRDYSGKTRIAFDVTNVTTCVTAKLVLNASNSDPVDAETEVHQSTSDGLTSSSVFNDYIENNFVTGFTTRTASWVGDTRFVISLSNDAVSLINSQLNVSFLLKFFEHNRQIYNFADARIVLPYNRPTEQITLELTY